MKIRWTTTAADDLENIFNYLQENHPGRARSTVVEIRNSVRLLKQFPHRGRKGREKGTHELPHVRLPYILIYRVTEEVIEILQSCVEFHVFCRLTGAIGRMIA
jgi:toxin ParE1/3/4